MRSRLKAPLIASMTAAIVLGAFSGLAQKKGAVPFPIGYRNWTHVKTMVIYGNQHPLFKQFGGLHSVYVNDLGLASLKQGKSYPDGTVFVFDLFDIHSAQGAIETRGRKFVAVMKKSAKLNPSTGGWAWEVFQGRRTEGLPAGSKTMFRLPHVPETGELCFFDIYALGLHSASP